MWEIRFQSSKKAVTVFFRSFHARVLRAARPDFLKPSCKSGLRTNNPQQPRSVFR
jgi:hypothetical protein